MEMEDGNVKKINPSNKIQQESLLKVILNVAPSLKLNVIHFYADFADTSQRT